MPWNGSGATTLTQDFSVDRDAGLPDSRIQADLVDDVLEDIAEMIEACVNRNGETAVNADINWGDFKITNLGAATAATDAARANQVASGALVYGGTTGGSSNAYTVTQGFLSALATGTRLLVLLNHTNTGAATAAVNGGSAIDIRMLDNTALRGGELVSGRFAELLYDGANLKLVAPSTASDQYVRAAQLAMTKQAVSTTGASLAIDMNLGWHVALSLGHTITGFTVSNWPPDGILGKLTLEISNTGSFDIDDYPGTTIWSFGSVPTVTSGSGEKDTIMLTSHDGGTNFRGYVVGQDMS